MSPYNSIEKENVNLTDSALGKPMQPLPFFFSILKQYAFNNYDTLSSQEKWTQQVYNF